MEKTIITYRGRKMFTLGHDGTFIFQFFQFLFGCGWLSAGIVFSFEEFSFMTILGYVFGLSFMLIAGYAMYENRKEVYDQRQRKNDLQKIKALLSIKKSDYKATQNEKHILVQDGKEDIYIIDAYAWQLLNEILLFTKSFKKSQVELIKLIYDGIGIDHYYFELDNNLIKDKFLREQKVITIKPTPFAPINTILIVKANMGPSPVSTENNYLCQMVDNNRRVMVPEDEITDYANWCNNNF